MNLRYAFLTIISIVILIGCAPLDPAKMADAEAIRAKSEQDAKNQELIRSMAATYAARPDITPVTPTAAPVVPSQQADVTPWVLVAIFSSIASLSTVLALALAKRNRDIAEQFIPTRQVTLIISLGNGRYRLKDDNGWRLLDTRNPADAHLLEEAKNGQ